MSASAFHDLPAGSFPFTIIMVDRQTRRECWRAVVEGPGALHVPSRFDVNEGRRISVRILWADGSTTEEDLQVSTVPSRRKIMTEGSGKRK